MKKLALVVLLVAAATSVTGCGYAGVAAAGDAVVVTRNDWFLFGLLRKTYVCKITPQGLTSCANAESP
ncbi:MAG TPA: hypothetical protein VHM19_16165 [Polyangiales bacterium]|jgi:hypothetical protein|nr:hypothetical protein [Polyangiales bacterium]